MKAVGIEMVDLEPMNATEAHEKGYEVSEANYEFNTSGYEVTHSDGYKSWTPKGVADDIYFQLTLITGDRITGQDVERFIVRGEGIRLGDKTTVVMDSTITGFDTIGTSACVDPTNYNQEIGNEIARKEIDDKIWGHLGFVLQWAKNGLNFKKK